MEKSSIEDVAIEGKRVFIRTDFNIPLDKDGNVVDDTRIKAALPTIQYAIEKGAKVIIGSHRGRPWGERIERESLRPVARRLEEFLGKSIIMADDCIGPEVEELAGSLNNGDVLLLENIRFHIEENENAEWFAEALANLADVYVNDAFGNMHRPHASIVGITKFVPIAVAGFLVKEEIDFLQGIFRAPTRPFLVVIGGAKVFGKDGKIWIVKNLLDKVDRILLGGKISLPFLEARGVNVGRSLTDDLKVDGDNVETTADISLAKEILQKAENAGGKILLPIDFVVADKFDPKADFEVVSVYNVPPDWLIMDIGPETQVQFTKAIKQSRTVIWNGPVGVFEMEEFMKGTLSVVSAIAESNSTSIIGGGDAVSATIMAGLADKITHLSSGGGAMVEYLMGRELPGLIALSDKREP